MVNQQIDGLSMLAMLSAIVSSNASPLLTLFSSPPHVLVKLHQEQSLILYVRKETILPDQVKDTRFPQAKVIRNSFSRLLVHEVKSDKTFHEYVDFAS